MVLTDDEKRDLERALGRCDAALVDKPLLAGVFDDQWRRDFRKEVLSVCSMQDASFPGAYGSPHIAPVYPNDYQDRIEAGLQVLQPKLNPGDWEHLVKRLRGRGSSSAEEEVLLARGLALEFGPGSIVAPEGSRNEPRPEYSLRLGGLAIDIEAKGLLDSDMVRDLWEQAHRNDEHAWVTCNPRINDVARVRSAVAKKLLESRSDHPTILVLDQYTIWPSIQKTFDLLRTMAADPASFRIPAPHHPLAIGLVSGRLMQGVWFARDSTSRFGLYDTMRERLRDAIRQSFYPRPDAAFYSEESCEA